MRAVARPTRYPIHVNDQERSALEALRQAEDWRLAVRARIILLAAQGRPNTEIAVRVGMSPDRVGGWRRRYAELGISGLYDKPRSGRPRKQED